jgi:hypothetical protein
MSAARKVPAACNDSGLFALRTCREVKLSRLLRPHLSKAHNWIHLFLRNFP